AYGNADDHWWYETTVQTTVKTGSHKEYQYTDSIYTYYMNRWPDQFNAWQDEEISEIKDGSGNDLNEVNTRTVYRYRFNLSAPSEVEYDYSNQREDFCVGYLGEEYAGKQVTLFIYKINEASDWTTEYLAQTVVDANGNYFFDPYILREEPTPETGDFTVTLGIEGADSAIYLGKIEVPNELYSYTVTYRYTLPGAEAQELDTQIVHRGEDAVPPELPVLEGYTFHHWDMRSTDIRSDTVINAIYEQNQYAVAFVDMQNEETPVTLQTSLPHGSAFDPPTPAESDELEFVGWQMENGSMFNMDGMMLDNGIATDEDAVATDNGVINAVYQPRTFTVVFGNVPQDTGEQQVEEVLNSSGEVIAEGFVLETMEEVPFGETVAEPENPDFSDDVLFYGWSLDDGSIVDIDTLPITQDVYFTPIYTFVNTAETPTVSLATGSYVSAQTATLNCATENAIIYYTLDGSDPANGENALACLPGDSIQITESCQLRAIASCFNMNNSEETDAWYAINDGQHPDQAVLRLAAYDEETVVDTMLVSANQPLDPALLPQAEGWTFEGAYRTATLTLDEEEELADVAYSNPWNLATDQITGDTILYLNYTVNSYIVTFMDEDGFVLSEQTVEYLSEAIPPEDPSMEGYVFRGWDTEEYLSVIGDLEVHAVYVPEDEYVVVSLNHSRYYTMTGSSFTLEATTEGNDEGVTLLWSSSDASVAVVDDTGRVTATGRGEAEITVTVEENGETAVCTLTVMGNPAQELTLKDSSALTVMLYQTQPDPENEEETGETYQLLLGFTVETEGDDHHAPTVAQIKEEFKSDTLVFTAADGTPLADTDVIGTGTVIRLIENGEVLDELTAVVSGDLDGDGYITTRDASKIVRIVVGKETADDLQRVAMDVNADGTGNNRDAALILRYLVGKESI
ncbi:MAG: InlB B-repeat-containing protein, partial [Clostridia bacterium]|nr:InlB B-repeat-containing protein [Clostridia bacterium]